MALSYFQEGMQSLAVKGTAWELEGPVSDATTEIDAQLNKLRAQKVIHHSTSEMLVCAAGWHVFLLSKAMAASVRVGEAIYHVRCISSWLAAPVAG